MPLMSVKVIEPHTAQITTSESDSDKGGNLMMSPHRLLQMALVVFGATFLLIYPLAIVWPAGWSWHDGAPYEAQYFMMIVGVYITLGVFLLNASRNPQAHRSLIWFTVWSSVVHAGIMAVQSMPAEHSGHRLGDVPGLFLAAIVLGGLLVWSENGQAKPLGPSVSL
jgi:FtsH-binding integral membrane protein